MSELKTEPLMPIATEIRFAAKNLEVSSELKAIFNEWADRVNVLESAAPQPIVNVGTPGHVDYDTQPDDELAIPSSDKVPVCPHCRKRLVGVLLQGNNGTDQTYEA